MRIETFGLKTVTTSDFIIKSRNHFLLIGRIKLSIFDSRTLASRNLLIYKDISVVVKFPKLLMIVLSMKRLAVYNYKKLTLT